MATVAESSGPTPKAPPSNYFKDYTSTRTIGVAAEWIKYAVQEAYSYKKTVDDAFESAIEASKSRLSQIQSTSSAHFHQTIQLKLWMSDALQDLKSEYASYENMLFGKIKEGVVIAASNPYVTSGVAVGAGLGFLVLQRTGRSLYYRAHYKALRLFKSEEAVHARADAKVKELQQSIDRLKVESETFEKGVTSNEDLLKRGKTKLRQTGKQIQGVIRSAYKIERQAGGLKDILRELPRREASSFQSQVSKLTSKAKQERKALTKKIAIINNYGISV